MDDGLEVRSDMESSKKEKPSESESQKIMIRSLVVSNSKNNGEFEQQ